MIDPIFCRVCGTNIRADEPIEFGSIEINMAGRVIWCGAPVTLTHAELIVLYSLVASASLPVTKAALRERIGSEADSNVIEALITRIKKKLRAVGPEPPLTSIWGSASYSWGASE